MSYKTDAVGQAGVFLARQLEQVLPKLYQKRYPALRYGNGDLLPVSVDLESGADSVIEQFAERVGEASTIADQVDDIPVADANINETRYPVIVKASALRYSVRELQAAQKGGRDIRGLRMMSARAAIEESINRVAAFGDSKNGLTGLLNDPNVPVLTETADLYNTSTVTADNLVELLTGYVSKIVDSTSLTEEPSTMLVPIKLHERMTNTRLPNSPQTVKQFILENNTWIKEIIPSHELRSDNLEKYGVNSGGTNKDAILIYPKNPDVVHRSSESLTVLPPQIRGLNWLVIMYVATTGAIYHYPGACLKVSIPKAT